MPWIEFDEASRPFVTRLYETLNRPTTAKVQRRHSVLATGEGHAVVYSPHVRIGLPDFEEHFRGIQTIAVSAVKAERALFLAWDIDRMFIQRLGIIRRVLSKRHFAEAAFAIQGDEDRGKIVLTLSSSIPQPQGVALSTAILSDAASNLRFGVINGDVTTFPNEGSSAGNTVRLFGKNRKRLDDALCLCEAPLDLTGSLSDLWYLQPAKVLSAKAPAVSKSTIHSRDTMVLSKEPYTGNGDTIAADMLRVAWRCESRTKFDEVCDSMLRQVGLTSGTRSQLEREDFRHRTWAKRAVGKTIVRESLVGAWRPLESPPKGLLEGGSPWRVYKAATDYLIRIGRNPHCFSITYGHWADLADFASKTGCGSAVVKAESAQLLVRIDRGQSIRGGLPTLVCFVGANETLQQAFDSGQVSDEFQERLLTRLKSGLAPNGNVVVGGRIIYPDSSSTTIELSKETSIHGEFREGVNALAERQHQLAA
jgi:hypothetical protein